MRNRNHCSVHVVIIRNAKARVSDGAHGTACVCGGAAVVVAVVVVVEGKGACIYVLSSRSHSPVRTTLRSRVRGSRCCSGRVGVDGFGREVVLGAKDKLRHAFRMR